MKASDRKLAKLVDELYAIREERYELQRRAKKIEERETEIRKALIAELPKFGASGVAGAVARAQLEGKTFKRIEDWGKLCAFVAKKKAWDLFQRRLNDAAVQARWDAKTVVPGVTPDKVTVVSLHKI